MIQIRYDLHVHSRYSDCSTLRPQTILKTAIRRGLDGIAVVDHPGIAGAKAVAKENKDPDFEVIVGAELQTDKGHVLLYYLNEDISSRNFFEVVDAARAQGALISLAHPFKRVPSLRFRSPLDDVRGKIDAIECFNGRSYLRENRKADAEADRFSLAKTGGSDSHFSFEIGSGATIFDGDLRKAIVGRKTAVQGFSATGPLGEALSVIIKIKNRFLPANLHKN
ncbi:MAG: PHP domain-containing protein [archaeon]